MKHKLMLLIAISTLSLSSICSANTVVSPMSAVVTPQGVAVITVESKAENVRFVRTSVKQVINPATKQEKEIDVDNASGGLGLIVTPPKLILTAGENRKIRIVNIQPPATETVYRVYVESLPAKNGQMTVDEEKFNSEVDVDLIWGVVVHVPPVKRVMHLALNADKTLLTNEGNYHLLIKRIGFCTSEDNSSCDWHKIKKNIYATQSVAVPANNTGRIAKIEYYDEYDQSRQERYITL